MPLVSRVRRKKVRPGAGCRKDGYLFLSPAGKEGSRPKWNGSQTKVISLNERSV